jgi:chorismate mutase/prephenate dehydratase
MKVAYLGPEKTFTEKAARNIFPADELVPAAHIRKVILAVENGEAEAGVIPFENYHNGKVIHTLDSLTKYASRARIVRERAFQVIHCFGALSNHLEINNVFSKDQALEQCDEYLADNYPSATPVAVSSTAEAARRIAEEKLLNAAAISSEESLVNSGLEVMARDICPNNFTRFIVLGRAPAEPTGDDKTFLAIHPPRRDEAGVLYGCLSFPAAFKVNLDDLVPRPDRKGGYYFYTEMGGHEQDAKVQRVVGDIKYFLDPENKFPDAVKVFGSYANTHWKDGVK